MHHEMIFMTISFLRPGSEIFDVPGKEKTHKPLEDSWVLSVFNSLVYRVDYIILPGLQVGHFGESGRNNIRIPYVIEAVKIHALFNQ